MGKAKTIDQIASERFVEGRFNLEQISAQFSSVSEIVNTLNAVNTRVDDPDQSTIAVRELTSRYNFLDGFTPFEEMDAFLPAIKYAWENSEHNDDGTVSFVGVSTIRIEEWLSQKGYGYETADIADLYLFHLQNDTKDLHSGMSYLPEALEIGMTKADYITGLKAAVLEKKVDEFTLPIRTRYAVKTGEELPFNAWKSQWLAERGITGHDDDFDYDHKVRFDVYDKLHAATGWDYETLRQLVIPFRNASKLDDSEWETLLGGLGRCNEYMDRQAVVNEASGFILNLDNNRAEFTDSMQVYAKFIGKTDSDFATELFQTTRGVPSAETTQALETIAVNEQARKALTDYFHKTNGHYAIGEAGSQSIIRSVQFLGYLLQEGYEMDLVEIGPRIFKEQSQYSSLNNSTVATAYFNLNKPAT